MSDDEQSGLEVPEHPSSAEQIGDVGEQIGEGLGQAEENIPEEEEEARAAVETTRDVVDAATNLAKAAEAGRDLVEAVEAGDEARAASSIGNLTGGLAGVTGGALDAVAGAVPEEAREGLTTAANVARGIGGAARATEQIVETIQTVERAVSGRKVRFQTRADLGEERLTAEDAKGRQSLSDVYEFRIVLHHDVDGGLDDESIDGLLTAPARLGFDSNADNVSGVLRYVEMLPMTAPRPTHYEVVLVPKLWRLSQVKRTRVFQDKTHLEVALEVLRHHGLEDYVTDHTEESYPTHEYVVQYKETDLDFVRRLLAHNGIHFRFVQEEPGREGIVLGDRNAAFDPVDGHDELRYHPHDFAPDDGAPRVWGLKRIRRPRERQVVMRDYNWRTSHHPLRAEEEADGSTGYGFDDRWGEHVRDDAQAGFLARVRAERKQVEAEVFVAQTSLRGVRPGTYFDLVNHPNPDLNQRYLVLETEEEMDEGYTYTNTFKAIRFAVPYRPPTRPWPRITGLINGIVDGDQHSTATPIDEEGRYRVVLPMDEAAASGGRASRWIRRAQPSAGAGYGMHLPLHIGTEVLIAHVNGDPDRPVIVGAVPNSATQSPVVGANATQSRIRTGSGIVFELDDDC
ncbi:MAG TPA: type VI secretion system tip protein TssI/VgrG [Sandaracinaceae bacterium LLY-WYZ-13_1]|nr:type VI secretion system tip protein TssI/VgrG [Sandaracinaceae bacterium LLY-WYZ-13_1]